MTAYLLDTNVVSEVRKGHRADPKVTGWMRAQRGTALWLSALVVGELRRGALLIERRDADAATAITTWLDSLIVDFGDRILPVTTAVAERWARLSVPDPVPIVDGLLAATAIEHDLVLVTRNVGDVVRTGVAWLNPFSEM